MTLVLDAGVVTRACGRADGFEELGGERLVAPPLMWSEARSTICLAEWRGRVSPEHARLAHERLEDCPVEKVDHDELGREAWRIAHEMGWGRTYDAEYVALARLLDCRLVTADRRLRRGADRLGIVIGPAEL